MSRLYVSNLPKETNVEDLVEHFAQYDAVSEVHIGLNPWDNTCRGYAHVSCTSEAAANRCLAATNGAKYKGLMIQVAKPRFAEVQQQKKDGVFKEKTTPEPTFQKPAVEKKYNFGAGAAVPPPAAQRIATPATTTPTTNATTTAPPITAATQKPKKERWSEEKKNEVRASQNLPPKARQPIEATKSTVLLGAALDDDDDDLFSLPKKPVVAQKPTTASAASVVPAAGSRFDPSKVFAIAKAKAAAAVSDDDSSSEDSEASSSEEEKKPKKAAPKKPAVVAAAPKKKAVVAAADSSSDDDSSSSDDSSDAKPKAKPVKKIVAPVKVAPKKVTPPSPSSSSDDESDAKPQIKKSVVQKAAVVPIIKRKSDADATSAQPLKKQASASSKITLAPSSGGGAGAWKSFEAALLQDGFSIDSIEGCSEIEFDEILNTFVLSPLERAAIKTYWKRSKTV